MLLLAAAACMSQRTGTKPGAPAPKTESRTVVVYPLAGCITEAEGFLKRSDWKAANPTQARFLAMLPAIRREKAKIPELVSKASESSDEIHRFLAAHGFPNLRLQPWSPPDFGMASVLKIQEKWLQRGAEDTVFTYGENDDRTEYPGVALREGISTYQWQASDYPVVGIKTKGGDTVYLAEFPEADLPKGDLDLLALAQRLVKEKTADLENPIIQITFPMVELNQRPDVSWFIGLSIGSSSIAQAIQETRVKLDLEGATVESAAAMEATRGGGPRLYQISRPFLCVITRPGLSQPFLVGYFNHDSWHAPIKKS